MARRMLAVGVFGRRYERSIMMWCGTDSYVLCAVVSVPRLTIDVSEELLAGPTNSMPTNLKWCAEVAVRTAGALLPGAWMRAMFGASDGLMRMPSPGSEARFCDWIVIHPEPVVLFGSVNCPV